MSIIADFAVPGGPTMTMCSPAIADTVIRRMISCLSRNCAPIWRARSWNAALARATSTAKLRGVGGGATTCFATLPHGFLDSPSDCQDSSAREAREFGGLRRLHTGSLQPTDTIESA